jgi:hypothetical protein
VVGPTGKSVHGLARGVFVEDHNPAASESSEWTTAAPGAQPDVGFDVDVDFDFDFGVDFGFGFAPAR